MTAADETADPFAELQQLIGEVNLADATRLRRRIKGARKIKKATKRRSVATELTAEAKKAKKRRDRRLSALPTPTYPPELPISARRDELIQTIAENQVVVVAGETGSGKSTQLPKLCIAAGRGRTGLIGHTQPRRIAARSVATRIAEELDGKLGDAVGYAVRFDRRIGDETSIKVMTDGILLAELERDPDLLAYDTLIVDEAHERSLNIDFLLGYLHQLLPRRPDLRLIITSATIDTEKIAHHFGGAPIIEVSGRTYPVEIRYRPRNDDEGPVDAPGAVRQAVKELGRAGPGDILVFSSGEREINEICESLKKHEPDLEVLPLFARLSTKEQQRVFAPARKRRVVVSTNVAETSLTVPGVRYVVDLGEARMSRFSQRTKVQRLPIEDISQASANQRSGRCGRLGPGIAVRLYDEEDFDSRPEFTEPEIQRTNLASVILTMADQGLGSPLDFPFIDPPDPRAVADGARLLFELNAVHDIEITGDRSWLTDTGRALARLPVDPRLGRMVLGGDEHRCLHEATIIAGALSVRDPRERPADKQQAADRAHEEFTDPYSDFLTLLHLWHAAMRQRNDGTRRQYNRWCRDRFLHPQRMIEWADIVGQIRDSTDSLGLATTYSHDFDASMGPVDDDENRGEDIHRAVLTGHLSQIGMRIERSHEYLGPRNARSAIQPGSTCFEARPSWIMAGELVETSRLWARMVAPIDPLWAEEPAEHLTTVEVGEHAWVERSGRALTTESVRLHGLPIVSDRLIPLSRHDAPLAREMFIHHALIEGEWAGDHYSFVMTNASVRREARNLAVRASQRRFDDEYERVWAFYDAALPAHITSATQFEAWYSEVAGDNPHVLEMAVTDLLSPDEAVIDESSFPEEISVGDLTMSVDYDHVDVGVAVDVPITAAASLDAATFLGVMPGHRRDAVIALARKLPKKLRRKLVPIPETVDALLATISETDGSDADGGSGQFVVALRHRLESRIGEPLPPDALDPRRLPDGLRPRYRIVDDDGQVLAEGGDLDQLRTRMKADIDRALADGSDGVTHTGANFWDFGTIPQQASIPSRQGSTVAYPTLVDRQSDVAVELVATRSAQRSSMYLGLQRLLRLTVAAPLREMNASMTNERLLSLALTAHGDRKAWFEDLTLACLGTIIDQHGLAWDEAAFGRLQAHARTELPSLALEWAPVAADAVDEIAAVRMALVSGERLPDDCIADAREHLDRLVFPGHLNAVGTRRFHDLLRYLRGIRHRLEKLPSRVMADRTSMIEIHEVERFYDTVAQHLPWSTELESIAWSLEELRVSRYAQHLGVTEKVSPTRIRKRLDALAGA